MTQWDKKVKKPNWDSLVDWEDKNGALVMWAITPDCIRERAKETNKNFKATKEQIHEFIYHSRRGFDMEIVKNNFKDFVVDLLVNEYGE